MEQGESGDNIICIPRQRVRYESVIQKMGQKLELSSENIVVYKRKSLLVLALTPQVQA